MIILSKKGVVYKYYNCIYKLHLKDLTVQKNKNAF